MKKRNMFFAVAATCLCGVVGCEELSDAEFEARRAELLAKPRRIMTDNDGNDIVYYDKDRPVTEEAFIASRIGYVAKTRAETMIYCPWCAGFGHFTVPGIGDLYTGYCRYGNTTNRTVAFLEKGLNALQMAVNFCRREKREIFLGIRMNDSHDVVPGSPLFPQWKKDNPDCLIGSLEKRPRRGGWSSVDFENPKTREYMLSFMRKFLEQYDVDGVEYDFFRHCRLFKSVIWAEDEESSRATQAQLDLMSDFMARLRALSEEVGRKRGKPILVAVRVPDSFEYNLCIGIDLKKWLEQKSVDIVIGGGYWQFSPWRKTAEKVHALGGKFYVSLDESRIGWNERLYPLGLLPGRKGVHFYAARMAAAMAEGADGVCFFNCQGGSLAACASIDPLATEGVDKSYFAVERGSGGYPPNSSICNGARFSTMPTLDPHKPHYLAPGETYSFEMTIGDDFNSPAAKSAPPTAIVQALVNYTSTADASLAVNGSRLPPPKFSSSNPTNGVFAFNVPLNVLKRGVNEFSFTAPATAPANGKPALIDFVLRIKYPKNKGGEK
jgi:hypothetical protein